MNPSDPVYIVTYFAMIIFFTYFYVAVTFNPQERADDMKKYMAASSWYPSWPADRRLSRLRPVLDHASRLDLPRFDRDSA